MIFEELETIKTRQTVVDIHNLILYTSKQREDDALRLLDYTSAQSKDKVEGLDAPMSQFICANEIFSIPDDAKDDAQKADLSAALEEFRQSYQLNTNTKQAFRHFVVSLPESEHLTNRQWKKTISELMKKLGYENCKYIAFKHNETNFEHAHIVSSTVDLVTHKIVNDFQSHTRAQDVMRDMEIKFGLRRIVSSKDKGYEGDINDAKKHNKKSMIKRKIDLAIKNCKNLSLNEFEQKLKTQGITIQLTKNSVDLVKFKGISFCLNNIKMSGTKIGAKYSLGGLIENKVLARNANEIALYSPLVATSIVVNNKAKSIADKQAHALYLKLKEADENHFNAIRVTSNMRYAKRLRAGKAYWSAYAKMIRNVRDSALIQSIYKLETDVGKGADNYSEAMCNLFVSIIENLQDDLRTKFKVELIRLEDENLNEFEIIKEMKKEHSL